MRFSYTGLIAVMLVVIAVALAGCAGSSPAAPAASDSPAAGTAAGTSSASSSSGSSSSGTGSAVTGASLFGGLSYNWVEYKMSTGSGDQSMTIYYKYDKTTGKCSMRFEGAGAANIPASMQNIDCSAQPGTKAQSNPNSVPSDAQVSCAPLDESVTVPAGTFTATKCTVTTPNGSSTIWVVKNKFLVQMQATTSGGSVNMVLNAYG